MSSTFDFNDFLLNDFQKKAICKQCPLYTLYFTDYPNDPMTDTSYTAIDIFTIDNKYCGSINSVVSNHQELIGYSARDLKEIVNMINSMSPSRNSHPGRYKNASMPQL